VDRIAAAPCVIVVGLRAAACLAAYLGFFLAKVHPHVLTVTEGGSTVYDRLLHRRPEDTLVVALGFPRYPREILELLRFLRARRFPVIGITDRAASPLASMVDLLLIAPVELITLFDSYACPMILLNVLVNEVGKRDLGRTGRMLEAFEVMAQEVDTFSQAPPRRAQEGIPHGGRPGRGPR
jgi:DNA-binding MurR/RpiR family transcriptional regulator